MSATQELAILATCMAKLELYFANEIPLRIFLTQGDIAGKVIENIHSQENGSFISLSQGLDIDGTEWLKYVDTKGFDENLKYLHRHYEKTQLSNIYLDCFDMLKSGKDPMEVRSYEESEKRKMATTGRQLKALPDYSEEMQRHVRELKSKKGLTGITSGYKDLDKYTGGWQNSDLIILAARPGMGKSAAALQIANTAHKHGRKVAVFTLEMAEKQLIDRLIAQDEEINLTHFRDGFKDDEEDRALRWIEEHEASEHFYIDTPMGLEDLCSKTRRLHHGTGIDFVVVDYLQLIVNKSKTENMNDAVGKISRAMKLLAKELDIPIILLSQLSRSVENRTNKRPILSDLRESGNIEQDADIVIFIYRDSYYSGEDEEDSEFIISKHRNGELGTVHLDYKAEYVKFEDNDFYKMKVDDLKDNFYGQQF